MIVVAKQPLLESFDSKGNGLRVYFDWCGDRFEHRIVGYGLRRFIGFSRVKSANLLTSVAALSNDIWPYSPPLQELNESFIMSDDNYGHVVYLLGSTTYGHWSTCVEAGDCSGDSPPSLVFDVACRARRVPIWLGSSYKINRGLRTSCDGISLDLERNVGKYRLTTLPLTGTIEPIASRIDFTPLRVAIVRDFNSSASAPITLRWRYRIEMLM